MYIFNSEIATHLRIHILYYVYYIEHALSRDDHGIAREGINAICCNNSKMSRSQCIIKDS